MRHLLIAILVLSSVGLCIADEPVRFHTVAKRPDSVLAFSGDVERTVCTVDSPFGIDQADVTRVEPDWPKSFVVRLRLRGLECFEVTTGDTQVRWSIPSSGDSAPLVSLIQNGKETPLTEEHLLYTQPEKKDGEYEVTIAPKLFAPNPSMLTLRWVDFYRN
ncbi:hypothetical protein [Planctomicrobium piriforme]|uniref:Uncharacterized protein n=1 Tax=Planctomicrobium piriforme TaxID=1576369 RepID=A0A1I3BIJ5_9PLAN|nr:hypothetical protein [Planctomicrobium piriforme]SFH62144.1 hypothetical protein SAMN05421753_101477 [Planctomicrobium piriforme]